MTWKLLATICDEKSADCEGEWGEWGEKGEEGERGYGRSARLGNQPLEPAAHLRLNLA